VCIHFRAGAVKAWPVTASALFGLQPRHRIIEPDESSDGLFALIEPVPELTGKRSDIHRRHPRSTNAD
jgi:hypothetical protein